MGIFELGGGQLPADLFCPRHHARRRPQPRRRFRPSKGPPLQLNPGAHRGCQRPQPPRRPCRFPPLPTSTSIHRSIPPLLRLLRSTASYPLIHRLCRSRPRSHRKASFSHGGKFPSSSPPKTLNFDLATALQQSSFWLFLKSHTSSRYLLSEPEPDLRRATHHPCRSPVRRSLEDTLSCPHPASDAPTSTTTSHPPRTRPLTNRDHSGPFPFPLQLPACKWRISGTPLSPPMPCTRLGCASSRLAPGPSAICARASGRI